MSALRVGGRMAACGAVILLAGASRGAAVAVEVGVWLVLLGSAGLMTWAFERMEERR